MMPLQMMATLPSMLVCGWAFTSLGSPLVAQRVWPMPTVAASAYARCLRRGSSNGRPSCARPRLALSMPGAVGATPAESWPRYSRRSGLAGRPQGLPHAVSIFISRVSNDSTWFTSLADDYCAKANPTRRLCRIGNMPLRENRTLIPLSVRSSQRWGI